MQKQVILIVVGLVLVVGTGFFVYKMKQPIILLPEVSATTQSNITLAHIALHNSRTSCWTAINGSVYDLTSWIPNHPGGESAILSICGTDGSNAYNNQHGGESKQASILIGFKIGTLTQ